ncbi:group II intron reverse transcriptase/maturase [Desulfonema magnum]|uniref:Group II intron-encoded protein n=1 Tax=Desulfonema magnum TaxID=45655 RepID=A0A975BUS1_9BACT|nr:group II intron reverse transcriptase/maturase [Desulfonema magnum]QTA91702.1 Group II intron-encoded protein [Desulfonema magnum]
MGDTQRSQTISAENQETAEQTDRNPGMMSSGLKAGISPPVLVGETSFGTVRVLAENNPDMIFTSLAHRIDLSLLRDSFRAVRISEAAGADGVTAKKYAENPDTNLCNLYQRLRRGQYAATPVKRIWLEKEDGSKRPIGIPAPEDKIVQKAVETVLYVIYNVDFYDFSHGFRKGHSQHEAIHEIREKCLKLNINWIADADVSGFFDNINHKLLQDMISRRVNDGGIRRLIGKWLKVGVLDEGKLSRSESGTPQGGVISPLLANIFLHNVLDDWFVKEVRPRMKGRCFIIRWADDFIIGLGAKSDAVRIMEVLPKRFERFGLSLNMGKTKLVKFGKPDKAGRYKPGTFDFPGFTFYRAKSLRGFWVIRKKTARKRLMRFMKTLWDWCMRNRHKPLKEQHKALCEKLRGYFQYFGVRSNYRALETVRNHAVKAWRFWLSRRSHKGGLSWEKYEKIISDFPLPLPRIIHNI